MMNANSDIQDLLSRIKTDKASFSDVLAFIESRYDYHPVTFHNGSVVNEAGQNAGSAKVFGFAMLNKLDQEDTLTLFAEHYQSVLATPDGNDHQNIRNFMQTAWAGIEMPVNPLSSRN